MGFIIALFFIGGMIGLLGMGPGIIILIALLLIFNGGDSQKD